MREAVGGGEENEKSENVLLATVVLPLDLPSGLMYIMICWWKSGLLISQLRPSLVTAFSSRKLPHSRYTPPKGWPMANDW